MKQSIRRFLKSTTIRLATTYLLIIMLMSIGFSIVFYNASLHALNRQVATTDMVFHNQSKNEQDQKPQNDEVRDFLANRAHEGREDLIIRLIILNSVALISGAALSYYLARRTLRPIEQAMEAQARFVSDASHELRTPLTSIQTSNDVALRNKSLTLAQAKQVISENTDEAIKLKLLSDGLLDLTRNDQTQHKLVPVSVQAAVADAMNQVIPLAQAKNIAIEDTTADVTVLSNQHILAQVLVIIIDNAIKYSPPDNTVYLSTTLKGNAVQLHVRDEGIGIRASDIPHLFRRFYRADTARANSHTQGYGLGLAIADSLMKAHDASITVHSELGKGSTFSIKLHLAKR